MDDAAIFALLFILFVIVIIVVFWQYALAVVAIGLFIWLLIKIKRDQDAHTKSLRENNEKKEQERKRIEQLKQNERMKQEAESAKLFAELSHLLSSSQSLVSWMPVTIAKAELNLDLAEKEFEEGVYSPFWEAMEAAVKDIEFFHQQVKSLASYKDVFQSKIHLLDPDSKKLTFSLGVGKMPDVTKTMDRMNLIYRKAQKDPNFAQIYEQRRTNSILIAGFESLGKAISAFSESISVQLDTLHNLIDVRFSNLEDSLQDSAKQFQIQYISLTESHKEWSKKLYSSNQSLIEIAKASAIKANTEAKKRRENQEAVLEMLNNIQRHRPPNPLL